MKLILVILLIALWTDVYACDCASTDSLNQTQISEYNFSEYILIGEISADNISDDGFRVVVQEVFKGKLNVGQIINFRNHLYCDPFIADSGKWLIYARMKGAIFEMNICGLSRDLNFPEKNRHFSKPPAPLRSDTTYLEKDDEFSLKNYSEKQRKLAKIETKKEIEALRRKNK